jgi:Helix-turn-helix domain
MWMPQWLEERPEVSEKAKKLYSYLTYFAGGKGYAWPSFNHLAEKLHVSRRYVIKLMQELSRHRLITMSTARAKGIAPTTTAFCGTLGCNQAMMVISA